jgi:tetratricopeptide (TPR) repeat protein
VRALIARGEGLAEQGKYYEAIKQYQQALNLAPSSALAHFRMAEAMFYQKNYQAAANAFRAALGGDQDPKWVEVWSHIYIGKIYDLLDQRARAVNEYQLAQHTSDDTAGAQEEVTRYMKKPYSADANANAEAATSPADSTAAKASSPAPAPAAAGAAAPADASAENKPVLKKRPPEN